MIAKLLQTIAESPPVRAAGRLFDACDRQLVRLGALLLRPVHAAWQRLSPFVLRLRERLPDITERVAGTTGRFTGPAARAVTRVPWPVAFCLLSLSCAAVAFLFWRRGTVGIALMFQLSDAHTTALRGHAAGALLSALPYLAAGVGVISLLGALQAFFRTRLSFLYLKAAAAAYAVFAGALLYSAWTMPATLYAIDREALPPAAMNEMWLKGTVLVLPMLAHAGLFMLLLVLRSVSNYYRRESETAPAPGDRLLRNVRTHGEDPRFRKSTYGSLATHLFFLIGIPLLMRGGCMAPYEVPGGAGQQVLEVVQMKVKKKIEKKYVFNENTAISFFTPKIEDSEIFEEVDELTKDVYTAQQARLGAGDGKKGGWPNGMEEARVRFIRLEYSGGDWDQDMGFGADYNMLLAFHELTGFDIWNRTESVRISQLKRFPRNRAPPFVYLTGGLRGSINVSQSEVNVLRDYCLKMGGMVFADNGGGNFDRSFRALMRRVFPDLPLVEIAYDDVIFRYPFAFPRGAPPLWHHSGTSAMGVKYRGRWVVFYHQGDINDAWKDGHSGATQGLAMQAYKMGINVINYAFNQYMQINFGGTVQR